MCPSLHRNSTASLGVGRGEGGLRESERERGGSERMLLVHCCLSPVAMAG